MSRRKGDPWKSRPHHRAFRALPVAAQRQAIAGFRANAPTTGIVEALKKDHAAVIAVSSLNRYRQWWETTERPVIEASEKAEELVRAFREHPSDELERLIQQLLQAQRLTAMTEDRTPDPIKLGVLDIEERKLRLKERALALRERQLEAKVTKAAKAVEGELKKSGGIKPETLARIKQEVYGIAS